MKRKFAAGTLLVIALVLGLVFIGQASESDCAVPVIATDGTGDLKIITKDGNGNKPQGCLVLEVWTDSDCTGTRVCYKSWAPAEWTFTGLTPGNTYYVKVIAGGYSRCDPVTLEASGETVHKVPCSVLKLDAYANDNPSWPLKVWRGVTVQVQYNGVQVAYKSWWNFDTDTFTLLDNKPHESYDVKITTDGLSRLIKGVIVMGDDTEPIVYDVPVGRLKVKLLKADYSSPPAGPLGAPITINCDGKFVTHAGHGWHTEYDFNLLAGQTYTVYVKWNSGKETYHDVTVLETTSGFSIQPDPAGVILVEP